MTTVNSYLINVNTLMRRKDGKNLSALLSLPIQHSVIDKETSNIINSLRKMNYTAYAASNVDDATFGKVVAHRLAALIAIADKNYDLGK